MLSRVFIVLSVIGAVTGTPAHATCRDNSASTHFAELLGSVQISIGRYLRSGVEKHHLLLDALSKASTERAGRHTRIEIENLQDLPPEMIKELYFLSQGVTAETLGVARGYAEVKLALEYFYRSHRAPVIKSPTGAFWHFFVGIKASPKVLAKLVELYSENIPTLRQIEPRKAKVKQIFEELNEDGFVADEALPEILKEFKKTHKFYGSNQPLRNQTLLVFARAEVLKIYREYIEPSLQDFAHLQSLVRDNQALPQAIIGELLESKPEFRRMAGHITGRDIGSRHMNKLPKELLLLPEFVQFLDGRTQSNKNLTNHLALLGSFRNANNLLIDGVGEILSMAETANGQRSMEAIMRYMVRFPHEGNQSVFSGSYAANSWVANSGTILGEYSSLWVQMVKWNYNFGRAIKNQAYHNWQRGVAQDPFIGELARELFSQASKSPF